MKLHTALIALLAGGPALAAGEGHDAALLAESCQICHGPGGTGAGAMAPIAGRSAPDLAALLTGFRDGTKPATIMTRLVKPLTDAEIAALAAVIAAWE